MRLIDADAKELRQRININFGSVTRFIIKSILKDAPTIDAVPVVHGRWISKTGRAMCSVCSDECWADSVLEYKYCPNCGARMDGDSK